MLTGDGTFFHPIAVLGDDQCTKSQWLIQDDNVYRYQVPNFSTGNVGIAHKFHKCLQSLGVDRVTSYL